MDHLIRLAVPDWISMAVMDSGWTQLPLLKYMPQSVFNKVGL